MPRLLILIVAVVALSGCSAKAPQPQPHTAPTAPCVAVTEAEIAALFDRWNDALKSRDATRVAARYAESAVLLPTLSDTPRTTTAERLEYFNYFLKQQPVGTVTWRKIDLGCNSAIDIGLYTFNFGTGGSAKARFTFTYRWDGTQWLISSHHSSGMPGRP